MHGTVTDPNKEGYRVIKGKLTQYTEGDKGSAKRQIARADDEVISDERTRGQEQIGCALKLLSLVVRRQGVRFSFYLTKWGCSRILSENRYHSRVSSGENA